MYDFLVFLSLSLCLSLFGFLETVSKVTWYPVLPTSTPRDDRHSPLYPVFVSVVNRTQGFRHARQALCQLSYISSCNSNIVIVRCFFKTFWGVFAFPDISVVSEVSNELRVKARDIASVTYTASCAGQLQECCLQGYFITLVAWIYVTGSPCALISWPWQLSPVTTELGQLIFLSIALQASTKSMRLDM